ncbi:MAG TPA: carboxypeptidase-like regulatory domain-containing protein [Longimicrobium sp.]|jgi:hypothetical protein|uniref:carboxypeptidase-like regulatory domain-containing protein n=1 Tax=Longimicrobium sp. TaxID=2029185 RepID=UPI002ED9C05F
MIDSRAGSTRAWLRWLALMLAVGAAPGVHAQVRGRIIDEVARPVAGASIELWAARERISGAESDAGGAFSVGAPAAEGALTLTVRRIGFRTRVIDLASADTMLVVRMEAAPVTLAPVTATARRRICPHRDDPRARAVWERMRSRYWQEGADSLQIFGLMETHRDTVARADIGRPGRTSIGWTYGSLPWGADRFLPIQGYAHRSSGSLGDRTTFWWYMHLDAGDAQHFTQTMFARMHTLAFVPGAAGETVIGFCPRERLGEKGQIEGTLTLRPDTTLARAQWVFRTREPVEDAGGEASYLPPDPHFHSILLAETALFWRKIPRGEYYVEHERYSGYRFLDGTFSPRAVVDTAQRQHTP